MTTSELINFVTARPALSCRVVRTCTDSSTDVESANSAENPTQKINDVDRDSSPRELEHKASSGFFHGQVASSMREVEKNRIITCNYQL